MTIAHSVFFIENFFFTLESSEMHEEIKLSIFCNNIIQYLLFLFWSALQGVALSIGPTIFLRGHKSSCKTLSVFVLILSILWYKCVEHKASGLPQISSVVFQCYDTTYYLLFLQLLRGVASRQGMFLYNKNTICNFFGKRNNGGRCCNVGDKLEHLSVVCFCFFFH